MPKLLTLKQRQQQQLANYLRNRHDRSGDRVQSIQWQQEGTDDDGVNNGYRAALEREQLAAKAAKERADKLESELATFKQAIGGLDAAAVQTALREAEQLQAIKSERETAVSQAIAERDNYYKSQLEDLKQQIKDAQLDRVNAIRESNLNRLYTAHNGIDFEGFNLVSSRYFQIESDEHGTISRVLDKAGKPFEIDGKYLSDPKEVFEAVKTRKIGDRLLWVLFEDFDQASGSGMGSTNGSSSNNGSTPTLTLTDKVKAKKANRSQYPGQNLPNR